MDAQDVHSRPSGTPPFWPAGSVMYWRYRPPTWAPGAPECVDPMWVVRDDARGLVAWLPEGTPILTWRAPDGRQVRDVPIEQRFVGPRVQALARWRGPGVLRVAPTAANWSAWLFRDDVGEVAGWYLNLEAAHVREESGIVSQDYVLDVWVPHEGQMRRKDEDELELAVEQGHFSFADAELIREHAAAAEAAVKVWSSPFCDRWEDWRPDATWGRPPLPAGACWDVDCTDS